MKRIIILLVIAVFAIALAACDGTFSVPGEQPPEGTSYYKVVRDGDSFTVDTWTPTPAPTVTVTATPTVSPTPTPTPTPTTTPVTNPVYAINNAKSGDTIVCPAGTFTGDVRVPAGVTVVGQGMDKTKLTGSMTWYSNTVVRNLSVGSSGAYHHPAVRPTSSTSFYDVRFYGGGWGGGVIGWNNYGVDGLLFDGCEFARNFGVWSSSGGAGLLWFAVDTSDGTIIKDVVIRDCHFGVSNGIATGSPTYGIVFWESDEAGNGYWGDILIENNTFEVTGEFTMDFDGNSYKEYKNNVVIRGNYLKGAGLPHDGVNPSWPYGICVEPARIGTVIENNTIGRCFQTPMKFTKGATDVVFRNNTVDVKTDNGVGLLWKDFFRTINIYDGSDNVVAYNDILLPSGTVSSSVIYNSAENSTIIGNKILQ